MIDNVVEAARLTGRNPRRITRPTPGCCPMCGSDAASVSPALPQPITAALRRTPMLTPRESAAFELLGLGYDNRSIARVLAISERTAKRHITAILTKLRLESRLQAGLAAMVMSSVPPAGAPDRAAWPGAGVERDEAV